METAQSGAESTVPSTEVSTDTSPIEQTQSQDTQSQPTEQSFADKIRSKASEATKSVAKDAAVQAAPVYQPNYKYKVHDQEKEFDEMFRPLVKDAETEKKVREMHEKLFGFEVIKPKYESRTKELESLKSEYMPIKEGIQELKEHVAAKDFDSFFKGLNIPEKMIFEWVAKKLQYENLSPEEKRRYDSETELRRENQKLSKESKTYQNEAQQALVRARETELQTVLSSPEVNTAMQSFDSRQGKVGAFREAVIRHAQAMYFSTGQDVSAKDAVESLMSLIGGASQAPQPTTTLTVNQQTQTKPPVIPNIKSRGGSPVKKHPTSFAELRAQTQARIRELEG